MSDKQYSVDDILAELAAQKQKKEEAPLPDNAVKSKNASDVLVDDILASVKSGAYTASPSPREPAAPPPAAKSPGAQTPVRAPESVPSKQEPQAPATPASPPSSATDTNPVGVSRSAFTPAKEYAANTTVGLDAHSIRDVLDRDMLAPQEDEEPAKKGFGFSFKRKNKKQEQAGAEAPSGLAMQQPAPAPTPVNPPADVSTVDTVEMEPVASTQPDIADTQAFTPVKESIMDTAAFDTPIAAASPAAVEAVPVEAPPTPSWVPEHLAVSFSGEIDDESSEQAPEQTQAKEEFKKLEQQREERVKDFLQSKAFDDEDTSLAGDAEADVLANDPVLVDSIPPYTQLIKERAKYLRKFIVTGILTLLAVYIAVYHIYPEALNPIVSTDTPFGYAAVSTIFIVLAAAVCYDTLVSGVKSFARLRLGVDAVCLLIVLVTLAQSIYALVAADANATAAMNVYAAPALLALLINLIGKLQFNKRMRLNSTCVESKADKYTVEIMTDELAREVGGVDVVTDPVVCTSVRSDRFGKPEGDELPDLLLRVLTIASFAGSLIVCVVTYLLQKDISLSLTALTVALCMCMPFSWIFGQSQPLVLAAKRLSRKGAYIINAAEIDQYCDTNAIVLTEREILPKDAILLQGIKTFGDKRIDEAIIDAASVACMAGGSISDVFLKIIENNTKILYTPDSITYEDNLGLYAWVNSKRILFGNRQLMINNGIDVPSKDYENKYMKGGRQLIYLSTSGELSAMFIISYSADPEVTRILRRLQKSKITLSLLVTDPNLTERYIAELFGLQDEYIRIVPERYRKELSERFGHQIVSGAGLVFDGQLDSYAAAILGMGRLKTSLSLMTAAVVMASVIGYGIVFFLTLTSGLTVVDALPLVLYQALWIIAPWLMARLL